MKKVKVSNFWIDNLTTSDLVDLLGRSRKGSRVVAFALHIGGINSRKNRSFVESLLVGDVLYADGVSIQMLARLAGAREIQRSSTTDIGTKVLECLTKNREPEATLRVALLGGPKGLAEEAGKNLMGKIPDIEIVSHADGYSQNWEDALGDLNNTNPDVVFIGMGMPKEAIWVAENIEKLPNCLIMTCGGWFGFLAGDESRAPLLAQRLGFEWVFRLIQNPKRLFHRYFSGFFSFLSVGFEVLLDRWKVRGSRERRR